MIDYGPTTSSARDKPWPSTSTPPKTERTIRLRQSVDDQLLATAESCSASPSQIVEDALEFLLAHLDRCTQPATDTSKEEREENCTCTQYLLPDDCPVHGKATPATD